MIKTIKHMKIVKTNRKVTIGDILHILFILFCLLMMIGNTIGSWWQLIHFGFSIKYLFIAIITTAATVFLFYITFTETIIISRINKDEIKRI